mmetsp:Transcript_6736/g.18306  ORF Transcript_6736/g.18306 Transcript_6736/m.18306 type:complete len:205 (+) Transcript_6736:360-974(+)
MRPQAVKMERMKSTIWDSERRWSHFYRALWREPVRRSSRIHSICAGPRSRQEALRTRYPPQHQKRPDHTCNARQPPSRDSLPTSTATKACAVSTQVACPPCCRSSPTWVSTSPSTSTSRGRIITRPSPCRVTRVRSPAPRARSSSIPWTRSRSGCRPRQSSAPARCTAARPILTSVWSIARAPSTNAKASRPSIAGSFRPCSRT